MDTVVDAAGIKLETWIVMFGMLLGAGGLVVVWDRLRATKQGFTPSSLRALGIVLFIPIVMVIGVVDKFPPEATAALLGTVAGYVLSRAGDDREDEKKE